MVPLPLSRARPQCYCLGTISRWLQGDVSVASCQSSCHVRPLVTLRDQVCCRLWRPRDRHLLFRGGKRLVGVQASQEAYSEHHNNCRLASKFSTSRRRLHGCSCKGLFQLHQGYRCSSSTWSLGRASTIQHRLRRIPEQLGWVGSCHVVLSQR